MGNLKCLQVHTLTQQVGEYQTLMVAASRRGTRELASPSSLAHAHPRLTGSGGGADMLVPFSDQHGNRDDIPPGMERLTTPSRMAVMMLQARLEEAHHELADREQQIQQLAAQASAISQSVNVRLAVLHLQLHQCLFCFC